MSEICFVIHELEEERQRQHCRESVRQRHDYRTVADESGRNGVINGWLVEGVRERCRGMLPLSSRHRFSLKETN